MDQHGACRRRRRPGIPPGREAIPKTSLARRRLGQPRYSPGPQRVDGAYDLQVPRGHGFGEHRLRLAKLVDDHLHVHANCVVRKIARHGAGLVHRRLNGMDERGQVARRLASVDGCAHGAAGLVSHDHDERRVQVLDRVLEACQPKVGRDGACGANREDVPQSFVEHDLGRDARVRTGQDDRPRVLSFDQLLAVSCRFMRVFVMRLLMPLVAGRELGEDSIGRRRRALRVNQGGGQNTDCSKYETHSRGSLLAQGLAALAAAGWNCGSPVTDSKKLQMSARSPYAWSRDEPIPCPASESKRIKSGLPLVLAACMRAAILAVIHGATRRSFSPMVNSTAGYAAPALTCW